MLHRVAAALEAHTEQILAENAKDVEEAKVGN
jgi:gamma-glutamyl phosphate reductase